MKKTVSIFFTTIVASSLLFFFSGIAPQAAYAQQQPLPDTMRVLMEDIVKRSSEVYNGDGTYPGNMILRWSNITDVEAGTSHVFSTECQPGEYPVSGTWLIGSAQSLAVISSHPSLGDTGNLAWAIAVVNAHESMPLPAVGGVLCAPSLIEGQESPASNDDAPAVEEDAPPRETQQEARDDGSAGQQQESDGGLTATLNGDSFSAGDTITVRGTVEGREPVSSALIKVIGPESETVELATADITADNEFTYSFEAGELKGFAFYEPMETEGNYRMVVSYMTPDFDLKEVEFEFEFNG